MQRENRILKIKPILLFIILNSCSLIEENGIDIIINNNTNSTITNIKCYTSEKLETILIEEIKPKESVSKFLSMKDNKTDGTYVLEFLDKENEMKMIKDGYYSNGASFNKWIEFTIEKDTVLSKLSKNKLAIKY